MQRKLIVFAALLGALAGIGLLVYLLGQEPPEPFLLEVSPPPPVLPTAPGPDEQAERQQGTLKGKVIDGLTKAPLEDARVIALRPYLQVDEDDELPLWGELQEVSRVTTGADGTFAIADLAPDYWNLWIERMGYAWTTVPRAKFDRDHVIEMFAECSIRGRVVLPDDSPAVGVRIEYTPQGTHSEVFGRYRLEHYYTETDRNGEFSYTQIPHGKFTVEVYPRDYLPAPWTAEPPLRPGENRLLGTHKLDAGFGMTVHVRWRDNEAPVEGVEVVVRPMGDPMPRTKTGQTRRTDARGIARFTGLGGQVIARPGFLVVANTDDGPVAPDRPGLVAPDEDVTIYLRRKGIVQGTVLDPLGEPVETFVASLTPTDFSARQLLEMGTKGAFAIHQVPEGSFTLRVRSDRFVEAALPVTVQGGQTVDVGVIRLDPGAEIYGTVRRSNGAALDWTVQVHLARRVRNERFGREEWETVARAPCRRDGSYVLSGVPAGSFSIWPEAVDAWQRNVTDPVPVTVAAGQGGLQVDLTLYGEGQLSIVFRDLVDGSLREVVPPATWLLEEATGNAIRWTGANTPLRPGRYQLSIDLPDSEGVLQRYAVADVRVQEGETTGPIEVALYEVRDGGRQTEGASGDGGDGSQGR